jgi:hypothetical protein
MTWDVVKFDDKEIEADTMPAPQKEEPNISGITLGSLLGSDDDENFLNFSLTEIHKVLSHLASTEAIDLVHAESLQQQALRGADILSEYLGKVIRIVGVLETKVNTLKNKTSLLYTAPEGRTTAEMKKQAGESSPAVEKLQLKLAEAKGAKSLLEKKYDILIKAHHHYKDISAGLRKTILGSQIP